MTKITISAILFLFLASHHLAFAVTSLPEVKTYAQLLGTLIRVREETKAEIAQAVRQAKVREAWETGTLIEKHLATEFGTTEFGTGTRSADTRSARNFYAKITNLYGRSCFNLFWKSNS